MDELIEKAKQHLISYNLNGIANNSTIPALMAEFARIYHKAEMKKLEQTLN